MWLDSAHDSSPEGPVAPAIDFILRRFFFFWKWPALTSLGYHFEVSPKINSSITASVIVSIGLIFLFQNCGKGFSSNSASSPSNSFAGADPTAPGPSSPSPTPGPTPIPSPSPMPYVLKNQWLSMTASGAPAGRYDHTAVWTGSKLIIFGGYGGTLGARNYYNDGGVYDPATDIWQPLTMVNAPQARSNHTATWADDRMIVFGGAGGSGSTFFSDGGVFQ